MRFSMPKAGLKEINDCPVFKDRYLAFYLWHYSSGDYLKSKSENKYSKKAFENIRESRRAKTKRN